MEICCHTCCLSNSDIIQICNVIVVIITAGILLFTLFEIKKSNEENVRLNRLQAAENTVMKQIEFHNNTLKGISINIGLTGRGYGIPNAPTTANGHEAFEMFYAILKENYKKMPGNVYKDKYDMDAEEKRIKDSFQQLYNEHGSQFGHYFKNLYLLIKYIKDIKIKEFDKNYFIDLVKSQLSKYEILLLAYDCIWIQDQPKKGENFIDFARDYKLLSALETKELIEPVSSVQHKDIFKDRYKILFNEPKEFTN